jgi:triacylglycerol esterase/lipase EstA (alpha/beta hydrolase family)
MPAPRMHDDDRLRRRRIARALVLSIAVVAVSGCASSQWVQVRDTPRNPLAGTLDLVSPGGPKPTPRTMQLLRRYDLAGELTGDEAALLARLEDIQRREPNREHEYAMAEVAYITAKRAETLNRDRALEFYGTALVHAYQYLFEQGAGSPAQGPRFTISSLQAPPPPLNPYDPQFRGASDLYNQSLEGMLRLVRADGELRPGMSRAIKTANHTSSFDVVMHSTGWRPEEVERFEFVSDYKVKGLRNHYHTYGLGVPLIAVRRNSGAPDTAEKFYPPSTCFPMTAFLRVEKPRQAQQQLFAPPVIDPTAPRFVLELYDSLDRQNIVVAESEVPLEADLSTPLAYFLNQPQFQDSKLSTRGLLHPGDAKQLQGLYMLEPFDASKMPIVMVHGLWSSPITWMEMYNDLRSDPLVREHYQFWFYLYPTGQPFWVSATQMREDLAMMRRQLDPTRGHPALDQMVLVGHSMGGLVSKLQVVESADAFWRTMSEREFSELDADADTRRALASMYFFRPNPSIRRVVTIGTPHRGSQFSNRVTRYLGQRLITLPQRMIEGRNELLAGNHGFFRPDAPLDIRTSIDSLAPDSPVLPVLLTAMPGPWIAFHNVVGHDPDAGWREYLVGDGDGVVSLESARLDDMRQLRSQVIVPADHISVHRHPQSILEVRRVLLEQLAELEHFPQGYEPAMADGARTNQGPDSAR